LPLNKRFGDAGRGWGGKLASVRLALKELGKRKKTGGGVRLVVTCSDLKTLGVSRALRRNAKQNGRKKKQVGEEKGGPS